MKDSISERVSGISGNDTELVLRLPPASTHSWLAHTHVLGRTLTQILMYSNIMSDLCQASARHIPILSEQLVPNQSTAESQRDKSRGRRDHFLLNSSLRVRKLLVLIG